MTMTLGLFAKREAEKKNNASNERQFFMGKEMVADERPHVTRNLNTPTQSTPQLDELH